MTHQVYFTGTVPNVIFHDITTISCVKTPSLGCVSSRDDQLKFFATCLLYLVIRLFPLFQHAGQPQGGSVTTFCKMAATFGLPLVPFVSTCRTAHTYASVSNADLVFFHEVLGADGVKTSPDALENFNTDWMGKYRGQSPVAVLPKTTEQVSIILRHCNERRVAVVPQGGNTGLVGGSVPIGGEVVLSTSRMNTIISFDPVSSVLVCEVCYLTLV